MQPASSLSEDLQDELEAIGAIFGTRLSVEYPTRLSLSPAINLALELPSSSARDRDDRPPTDDSTCSGSDDPPPPPPKGTAHSYLLRMVLPAGYPDAAAPTAKVCRAGFSAADPAVDEALQEFLSHLEAGEPLIFEIAEWVSAHVESLPPEAASAAGSASTSAGAAAATAAAAAAAKGSAAAVLERQWIYFIGFYTKSIRDAFCDAAGPLGCTGFLMPGKPAIAAVEGCPQAIAEFIRVVRTDLFAQVPPGMRKMTLSLLDRELKSRAFAGFEQIEFSAAAGTHKRKDITDLARLEQFLVDRSMGHAFEFIFKGGQGATAART